MCSRFDLRIFFVFIKRAVCCCFSLSSLITTTRPVAVPPASSRVAALVPVSSATLAQRGRTSSRKRLLLRIGRSGWCRCAHAPNPAGRCRHAPSRAVLSAVAETRTLPNHRPSWTLLQVDRKALWRCGLCAAEALWGSVRLRDATSPEGPEQPRSGSGMNDGRGLRATAR